MLFSLSMFPVGAGDSLADPVAEVVDEIDRAGLSYELNGANTVIEGEWDEVLAVIQRAERRLSDKHDRVYTVLTVDDHKGGARRLQGAVEDVERKLGRPVAH